MSTNIAWRQDAEHARGSLKPVIYFGDYILQLRKKPTRFLLATCDLPFFEKYSENTCLYEKSSCMIPYLVGIYSDKSSSSATFDFLSDFKKSNRLTKFYPFVFGSPSLDWVLAQQDGDEIKWDYKINYIRNSRYNIISTIWELINIENLDLSINEASSYIIDFDNVIKDDINHAIKRQYGDKKLVVSWNSAQSPNPDFPDTLSTICETDKGIKLNHPYKVLKAGFTVLSPSPFVRKFLYLYESYSIGDSVSMFYLRLFTFYFSDQVAILLALRDLTLKQENKQLLGWIDINHSKIVNLRNNDATCMWYPKGISNKKK